MRDLKTSTNTYGLSSEKSLRRKMGQLSLEQSNEEILDVAQSWLTPQKWKDHFLMCIGIGFRLRHKITLYRKQISHIGPDGKASIC